jgi:hypothetical protein
MSSAYQINIMFLVKGGNNLLTKSEADSSVIFTPTLNILIGIWPKEIAEKTCIWHICGSHNSLDLFETAKFWAKSSMHAKNFLVNDSCNWETVETISKCFPELDVVASLALIIESIDSVDGCALVVSSEEEEIFWILDLIGQEQANSL